MPHICIGILYKTQICFRPSIVKLFNSFFSNRLFCVQFGNVVSDIGDAHSGVPQGSILAPHLYTICMCDFPDIEVNSCGLLYVDDSLLYSRDESPLIALDNEKPHLVKVRICYDDWGIRINFSKSEAICIRNSSGKCQYFVVPDGIRLSLNIDGTEIHFKNSIK